MRRLAEALVGARRRARRPGRAVHADVPRGRGRVARVRPCRRGAGADLLRLRGTGDPAAPRGLRREGRDLRRLVAAARAADRDGRDGRRGRRRPGAARVEPRRGRVAGRRRAPARHARPGRGRLRAPVPDRLHVGDHRHTEGRRPRPRRLPRLDRARGRLPDRCPPGRADPLRHRHGLDHGPVDRRRRRRRGRHGRPRGGRARLRPSTASGARWSRNASRCSASRPR